MSESKKIKIKPILAFLCDDVRQENNGKPFILGVYQAGITIKESNLLLPPNQKLALSLALWVAYEIREIGQANVEFQLIAPNPQRKVLIKAQIRADKLPPSYELSTLSFNGLMVPVEKEGNIQVMFKHEEDSEWEILREVPVTMSDGANAGGFSSGTVLPS